MDNKNESHLMAENETKESETKESKIKEDEIEEIIATNLEKNPEKVLNSPENPVTKKKVLRRVKKLKNSDKKGGKYLRESQGCLFVLLGLILPVIGIVLSFFWTKNNPGEADGILKGSLITTVLIGIVLSIIFGIQILATYLGII